MRMPQIGCESHLLQEPLRIHPHSDVPAEHVQHHRLTVAQVLRHVQRGQPAPTHLTLDEVSIADCGSEERDGIGHVGSPDRRDGTAMAPPELERRQPFVVTN